MSMNNMVDLETLGQRFDAPIITVGAVFFDPATGELGPEFYRAVDLDSAIRFGRVSGETLKWWFKQSDAARHAAVDGKEPLDKVLKDFADWYRGVNSKAPIWGNGPTFDITILEDAYWRVFDKEAPWKFWNVRDCRTILELGQAIGYKKPDLKGVAHNALDDARHQAQWVCEIHKLITDRAKKVEFVNTVTVEGPVERLTQKATADIDDM